MRVQPLMLLQIIIIVIINTVVIKPFRAEDGLHTPASVGVVMKPPFYTWCPRHQIFLKILYLVSWLPNSSFFIIILKNHIVTIVILIIKAG